MDEVKRGGGRPIRLDQLAQPGEVRPQETARTLEQNARYLDLVDRTLRARSGTNGVGISDPGRRTDLLAGVQVSTADGFIGALDAAIARERTYLLGEGKLDAPGVRLHAGRLSGFLDEARVLAGQLSGAPAAHGAALAALGDRMISLFAVLSPQIAAWTSTKYATAGARGAGALDTTRIGIEMRSFGAGGRREALLDLGALVQLFEVKR